MSEPTAAASERTTPQMGYGSMAGIMISESDKLLQALLSGAKMLAPNSVPDDFLIRFARNADAFSVACCEKFAAFLRENSIHAEVRSTAEGVLARLVRNRCFEAADTMLIDYLAFLEQAGISIGQVTSQLADSRVRDSFAQRAGASVEGEEEKKLLSSQVARAYALIKILDFLGSFRSLAQEFLDYGSSKLFGGDVDFALQERFLQNITDSTHEKRNATIAILEGVELVKQRKWEQQRAAETATIKAAALMAGQSQTKRKSGVSSLVIAALCAAPIVFLLNLGIINRYVIGLAVAFGLTAIVFLFRGIIHLTKG